MKKIIITEEEKKEILNLHQFKKFILEASEHSENLYKSWANKKSGNPELALSLMNDFFNLQKQLPKKDFTQYKTAEELKTDIDKLKSQTKKPEEDADVIYKDNNLLVVATKTWEAGCKYGSGTKWCTSSKDTPSYWSRHNSTGTEFIWISKNLSQNNPLHKVSLHFKGDDKGRTHDWCTAINDCGYDNPYKKKNINIPNFDEILKKCQEYHNNRFESINKTREENRKKIMSLPIYKESIKYLNDSLNNLNINIIGNNLIEKIIYILQYEQETLISDMSEDEYQDLLDFIDEAVYRYISGDNSFILEQIKKDLLKFIYDTIYSTPEMNSDYIQSQIDDEINEIFSEHIYPEILSELQLHFPDLFNDY